MNADTAALRTALLTEVKNRVQAGEDAESVLLELRARPEWERVVQAQGLR